MATITFTNGAADGGKWSTPGNWDLARAPLGGVGGDDAVIPKNLTAVLDTAGLVCKSLRLTIGTTGADVGGILTNTTTANWDLTVYNGIVSEGSTGGATYGAFGSKVLLDMSAAPTYTGTVYQNGAASLTTSNVATTASTCVLRGEHTLKGATRKRWTFTTAQLVAATTSVINIEDVTGWRAGDKLVFATTQAYNASPAYSEAIISSIGAITGTAADVTLTASITNSHDSGCLVGNFTSNLVFTPVIANNVGGVALVSAQILSASSVSQVEFRNIKATTSFGMEAAFVVNSTVNGGALDSCVFYQFTGCGVQMYSTKSNLLRTDNQYFTTKAASRVFNTKSPQGDCGDDYDSCIYRATPASAEAAFGLGGPGMKVVRPKISGITGNAAFGNSGYGNATVREGGVWSSLAVDMRLNATNAPISFEETYLGKGISGHVYANANNSAISKLFGAGDAVYKSCLQNISGGAIADATAGSYNSETFFYNKDNVPTAQEVYSILASKTAPVFVRDNGVASNANASLRIDTLADFLFTRTFKVPAQAGVAATIFIYTRKNGTFSVRPTAQLTGLGTSLPAVTMSTADDQWELLDLSFASGAAPTVDGELTLTLSCQSSSASAYAYFSGIPLVPFVTRCRHYGYLFNETSPTRDVDVTIEAVFATADTYTGFSITWGASSTIDVTANNTFQKMVDYTAAKATANISSALPITWAGVAGSPIIFAQGDIDIADGFVLNGAGSLSIGSYILTSEFSGGQDYSYTDGSWSQLSTIPSFSGGVLTIGAEATLIFSATALIIELTPSGAGVTYDLTGGTFSGTIYLKNLTVHAINVSKESGPTFDTSLNVGGTITLIAPTVNQAVALTGLSITCRVQLYDTDLSTELYNAEPGATTLTWTDPAEAVATRSIRLRITDYLGATAKIMIERNIGTCGITEETASISFANEFSDDTDYNAQAAALGYNGGDITDITIVDATNHVNFNFTAGGDYDARRIYMYMVYWLDTEAGIRDDFVFCSPLDPVNLPMQGVLFENVTSPQEIITFINAYVYDSTTGRAKDLIVGDGINFAPDHVVQVIASVGGVNIITGDIADVAAEVQAGLTSQGLTTTRAAKLDNLDQKVSRLLVSTLATR